ncbi:MAG: hypothetical protein FWE35_05825 [Streptosporangiales bacterium]|jgi:hypothetical protein|nr:hypothetical protein [Streptosporangiales bacterium]
MAVAVTVTATITGHRRRGVREHALTLDLAPGEVPARDLISAAVAAEVAAYQARAEENAFVRVLTPDGLAAALAGGSVRPGNPDVVPAADADPAESAAAALLAFEDGIFKVFVGDREMEPGSSAWLEEGASLLFLRLVPLAGG